MKHTGSIGFGGERGFNIETTPLVMIYYDTKMT